MPRRTALTTAPVSAEPWGSSRMRAPTASERALDIGGYRLVRRLDDDIDVSTWVARGSDETVVLRVFRDAADDARIDAEALARERIVGPHAPELLDIATGPSGRPALVVRAVIGPTLSDLLERSVGPLRAGHLTTLLAPLAALVAAAHETGATLGRLDTRGIRIDPSGRPVVVALGRAQVGAPLPERFRGQEPGIVDDRIRLDALASELAQLVDPLERASIEGALARAARRPELLELALFDCAAPMAVVDLGSSGPRSEPAAPAGAHVIADDRAPRLSDGSARAAAVADAGRTPDEHEAGGPLDDLGRRLGLPPDLLRPLDQLHQRIRRIGESIALGSPAHRAERSARTPRASRGRAARPRRTVVLVGVAGALSLLLAVVLATGDGASRPDGLRTSQSPSNLPTSSPSASPPPAPATALPESADDPTTEQWAPLIASLVDRWLLCAADPAEDCVAQVTQTESAAHEQLLGSAAARAETAEMLERWAAGARESIVVDRHGDAVVVDLVADETATASLLVMRSEAGWRLRAVMPSSSS